MFTRATKASIIVAGLTITAVLLVAGDGNSLQFDKKVYNLAREKQTQIIVKEDTGYKFSGKSKKISGDSAINGTTVRLRLSRNADDTQVSGFFIPTLPNEREMWVPSQIVTVIEHYIDRATFQLRPANKPRHTVYRATVIAGPVGLGRPDVKLILPGDDPIPMRFEAVGGGISRRYNLIISKVGVYGAGTVNSTFFNDTANAKTAPLR